VTGPPRPAPARDWHGLAAVAILAAAGLLRYAASLGDFWLDEIWAWFVTRDIPTFAAVLTGVHHDNNHYLYTWFLQLLGPDQPWTYYRLPSVLAGIGSVFVAGLIGGRSGRGEATTAMLLTAGSYLQIYYASEARGYGCVIFFALLSFWLLDRSLRAGRPLNDLAFALAAILGFLSHLEFVFCYAGLVAWSCWRLYAGRTPGLVATLLRCHLPPVAFVSWLWIVDISKLKTGGADVLPLRRVVAEILSMTLGGPALGPWAVAVAAVAAAGAAGGVLLLARRGGGEWVFWVTTILVAPVAISLAVRQDYVYPRHFLVSSTFALLAVNHALVRLTRYGRRGRAALAAVLIVFLGANSIATARLLRVGRGQYRKALLEISERTPTPEILIGSDNMLRNGMVIEFYKRKLRNLKPIQHFAMHPQPGSREIVWPREGVQWVLVHRFDYNPPAPATFTDGFGNRYRLVQTYPYAGPSGWSWSVYRAEP